MRYRRLGKSELRVSVIGLGTYQFGGRWGKDFTQREVDEILTAALECGINLIDTAKCYGMNRLSETLIGRAITSTREHWILATKFGHDRLTPSENRPAWSPAEVRDQLEGSLRALRTEHIDLYQFHSGSNEAFDNDELWAMLGEQKRLGKIGHLGVSVSRRSSEWRIHQVARAEDVGASVIQVKYNRLEREAEEDALPMCVDQDLGVMARVPLASGLLSGRYQHLDVFEKTDARAKKYDRETIARLKREIDTILESEIPEGLTLPEHSLLWSLAHPAVSCVIPGCKTAQHVRQNAGIAAHLAPQGDHPQDLAPTPGGSKS
ncbi:MAG: aldo/keto reductase [Candidatus Bipolaricaulota bacterium]|nr:MAG: aldo/keto reductase [Candidatus Bipolaricaulota bacterium]